MYNGSTSQMVNLYGNTVESITQYTNVFPTLIRNIFIIDYHNAKKGETFHFYFISCDAHRDPMAPQ